MRSVMCSKVLSLKSVTLLRALSAITNKMENLKVRKREKGNARQRETEYRNMPRLLESIDSLLNQYTVWCSAKPVCLSKIVDAE